MTNSQPGISPAARFPLAARVAAALLLLAPFVGSIAWSRVKYFWIDELLEYYSDTRPSGLAVIRGQMHHPFSLEPPLYHLLLHYCLRVFPHTPELAARLPAILLFALLQWCLLRLVMRLTDNWGSALVAAAIPFAVSTYLFSPEARVYELLACMFAIAMLAYCTALQSEGARRRRAFIVLSMALSVAVLSHYYGIFEPVPFVAAEIVRSWRNRRLERAPWIALVVPFASFALNLPFVYGLHTVQARYYIAGQSSWDRIPFTYLWLFGQNDVYDHDPYSVLVRRVAYVCAFGLLPLAVVSLVRRRGDVLHFTREADRNAVLLTAVFALFVPVLTVTVAHFVTHAYWPRYSVETVVAATVIFSVAAAPMLRGWRGTASILIILLGLAATVVDAHYEHDGRLRKIQDDTMALTPDLLNAERTLSDPHIYVQQVNQFLELSTFLARPQRSRLVEFDSPERAAFYDKHTPGTAFAENIAASTSLPFVPYEQLRRLPGKHLLLVFKDPVEEWIGSELARPGVAASVVPAGKAFGGLLYLVTFEPQP